MNRALEDELARRYPGVFRGRNLPGSYTLATFGIEHGDGWYSILNVLADALTAHARDLGREPVGAFRIREDLGRLSFAPDRPLDTFERAVIWVAYNLSGRTCERTGAPGRTFYSGDSFKSLAPDVAARIGWLPAKDDPGYRLRPMHFQDALERLAPEARAVLQGPADMPPGWSDLGEILLTELAHRVPHDVPPSARVLGVRPVCGRLAIEIENARRWDTGAAAFLAAMSTRTDPQTGVAYVPDPD